MVLKIIGEDNKDENLAMDSFASNVFSEKDKEDQAPKNYTIQTVFPFSNENLTEIFKNLDLNDKRVATVGSSGDQAIYSILKGCKDITVIDANPMSQPYIELKLAAIKNLNYLEFLDYFTYKNILSGKYYAKVSHDLSDYAKGFWDNIIMEIGEDDDKSLTFMNLFQSVNRGVDFEANRGALLYCQDKLTYNKLKSSITGCKINFVVSDFENFAKELYKKYDFIMLSNIYDYIDKETFFKGVKNIKRKHLKRDGKMQVYYNFLSFYLNDFMTEFEKYFKLKNASVQKVNDIRQYSLFKEIIDEGSGNSSHVIYL